MGGLELNTAHLKTEIIQFAHSIGIDQIGFTTADPFDELKQN